GGPGDHVAVGVGDRNDRVVERALDVGVPVSDVLLLLAAHLLGADTALRRHLLSLLSRSSIRTGRRARARTTSCRPSSCRPRSSSCPCGCARWSACADRAREARGGAGCPGRTRSRSCGGCPP